MKKKICLVCSVQFTYEKFIKDIIKDLSNNDYEISCVFNWDNPKIKPIQEGVIFKNMALKRSASLINIIGSILKLFVYFRSNKFDLIQVHTPIASLSARIAAKIAGCKCIVYKIHGFYFHENMPILQRYIHIVIEILLAKITSKFYLVSKEDTLFASMIGMKNKEDIFFIGNGINSELFKPINFEEKCKAKEDLGLNKENIIIGFVARLVEEKGLLELFDAFRYLINDSKNIQLLICGSKLKSDYGSSVYTQLSLLKEEYPDKIIITGYLENTILAYNAMDIYCPPSWREGMPYTVLEAMMCGLPVITSDIRGCREAVIHNETGLICKPKDKLSLYKSLKYLVDNPNERINFGKGGYLRAKNNFDSNLIKKKEIDLLKKHINLI